MARGVVQLEEEVLEGGQEDHQDWRGKEDVAGDQASLFLREHGDGGVDIDDCEAGVGQGHQHEEVLKAEDEGLAKILTSHLRSQNIVGEISFT